MSVESLWQRWEAWLRASAPGLLDGLGDPATGAEIAAAAEALGAPLPGDLEALYRAHDGAALIVGGYDIASLEDLVEARSQLAGRDPEIARCLPFVDHGGGEHFAIDPAGRVIELAADAGPELLADDLESWMAAIVADLERGLYRWNDATEMFEPETLATGFRWLSTVDGRRNAFVLEPGESRELAVAAGEGIELVSFASLEAPGSDATLWIEVGGARIWERALVDLRPGDDSGPGELEVGHKVDAAAITVGVDRCHGRAYFFHQAFDVAAERVERGLADLKRLTSVGAIEPVVAQIAALVDLGLDRDPAHAATFYKACARAALELATGGSVFEATRLVRAVMPHVAAIGGDPGPAWHFARAAVDVAIEANDPELVAEIDRVIPAVDLATATDRLEAPEAVFTLYNLACLYSRFGDRDGCLRYAELALERRVMPAEFRDDPDFAPLAGDPDFAALLERFRPDHDAAALYLIVTGADRQAGPVEIAEGELRNDRDAGDDDRFFVRGVGDVFFALDQLRDRAELLWPVRVHADSDLVRDEARARYRVDGVDVDPALPLAGAAAWELLFEHGLEPTGAALEWPARNGWTEAVALLCDRGADLGAGNPLFHAAHNGHAETAALLCDRGADLTAALRRMVHFDSLEGVVLLEAIGADLGAIDPEVIAEGATEDPGVVLDYVRSRR
jgi:hypothetical protein